jgi:hypothetical protein
VKIEQPLWVSGCEYQSVTFSNVSPFQEIIDTENFSWQSQQYTSLFLDLQPFEWSKSALVSRHENRQVAFSSSLSMWPPKTEVPFASLRMYQMYHLAR